MPGRDASHMVDWLNALSEQTRLRLLLLLEREELSVGELARIVQLPQSTVSRHLKQLADLEWIGKRSAGTASIHHFDPEVIPDDARSLWSIASGPLRDGLVFHDDLHRMREVLAERPADGRAFFGRVGFEWDDHRRELFGRDFSADALLALLDREMIIADIGCGTGNVAGWLAPIVKRVIAIDREPAMIAASKDRLREHANIDFRDGDLEQLPLQDDEVDAAVVSLVLHHVEYPSIALRELARVVKRGGMALVIDMVAHNREDFHHTMGHVHLGFEEGRMRTWGEEAGFTDIEYRRLRPDTEAKGPGLFVATLRGH